MGFIKRFAPFAIAFSLGLFIASFFVDISAPRFSRGHHKHKRGECKRQLEAKVAELERQNAELRSQIEIHGLTAPATYTIRLSNGDEINSISPDVPVPPPLPVMPSVPHSHK